ncbi:hypothetical protein JXB11_01435 [Candidatus Woesearchaeota archaeon]|nr:hypothetical protein [Candidatus Woesearchaeota archaeon]
MPEYYDAGMGGRFRLDEMIRHTFEMDKVLRDYARKLFVASTHVAYAAQEDPSSIGRENRLAIIKRAFEMYEASKTQEPLQRQFEQIYTAHALQEGYTEVLEGFKFVGKSIPSDIEDFARLYDEMAGLNGPNASLHSSALTLEALAFFNNLYNTRN